MERAEERNRWMDERTDGRMTKRISEKENKPLVMWISGLRSENDFIALSYGSSRHG